MQTWLWQSLATLHAFQAPQPAHDPPQSIPVSEPFFTPSEQLGFWHTLLVQTPLRQSPPFAHPWPAGQSPQLGPPQSVPVSLPFFTPSEQVGT